MTPRFNEQVQRWLVSMIQSGGCFEAVSLARSVFEGVGDLVAASLGDGAHAAGCLIDRRRRRHPHLLAEDPAESCDFDAANVHHAAVQVAIAYRGEPNRWS